MRMKEAIQRFETQLAADGRSDHTRRAYVRDVRCLAEGLGWPLIEKVRPGDVARHFSKRRTVLAPISLNRAKTAIRIFFDFLVEGGVLETSPARLLRNGRAGRPLPKPLSPREADRLLRTLARSKDRLALRDRALFTLLLTTGLRLGSAMALDLSDIDLRAGTARVQGKGESRQLIFLPPRTKATLRAYVGACRANGGDKGAAFLSTRGRRLTARQAQFRLKLWLTRADLPSVGVHALRHTFATRLYAQTRDLRLVQQALGHRSVTSTEIYTHLDSRSLRQAMRAV